LKHVAAYFYNIIKKVVSMVINNNSLTTPGEGANFPSATILVTCNKTENIGKT
jgi:hypothetical protein